MVGKNEDISMKFEEVYSKYLEGSTVSEHQAKFIWNHAIKHLEDKLIRNFYPNSHDDIYRFCNEEIQENKVPDYFK
jgi:hypothetical protein